MKYTLLFILFLLIPSGEAFSQEIRDGIYCKINEKKCIYQKVSMKNSRLSACIPDNPVLLFEDAVWVSDLKIDAKTSASELTIKLSENGSKRLAAISEFYLGEELAFVFDNKIVFLLKVERVITSGKIFLQDYVDSSILRDVQNAIKELLLQKEDPR